MSKLMAEPESTAFLVRRAQEGDREALGQLFALAAPRLEVAVRARLGEKLRQQVEPDDILQETFAWATRSIARFQWRGEDSFLQWLRGIAGHMILKAANQSARGTVLRLEADAPAGGASPSKVLRREERFAGLEKALADLSPADREVVLLARIDGLPVREIARRLGRTENAVMLLLSRALKKLRGRLSPTESLHLPDRTLGRPREEEAHGDR